MTKAARSRGLQITFVLAVLVATLALIRWSRTNEPAPPTVAGVPSPRVINWHRTPVQRAQTPARSANQRTLPPTERASEARPTPSVVDIGALTPAEESGQNNEEERFPTNEWFTEEDQHHPELYFERAEEMPELNRPEERRDTLAFFLAYREKLQRDLDALGEDSDARQEIVATIERYDSAIARLRRLIEAEETN